MPVPSASPRRARGPHTAARRILALFFCVLAALLSGCEVTSTPELLRVVELAPREVELGDRVEVRGDGFAAGRVAKITLRGTLHRPAESPIERFELTTEAVVRTSQRAELVFTESLQARLCGVGDAAVHTTFRGIVEVSFPAALPGAPPVSGSTATPLTVDFIPTGGSRTRLAGRVARAEEVVRHLGLTVGRGEAGVVVEAVSPGSPAERAEVGPGDRLTSFDGVRILELADLVPSGHRTSVELGLFRRGAQTEDHVEISTAGLESGLPRELAVPMALLGSVAGLLLLFFAPWSTRLTRFEVDAARVIRRTIERGPWPWVRSWAPARGGLLRHAPTLVQAILLSAFLALPFTEYLFAADLDVAILLGLTAAAFAVSELVGTETKNWRRAVLMPLARLLPVVVSVGCFVFATGTMRLREMVATQGGAPWEWTLSRSPLGFVLFALFFASTVGFGPPRRTGAIHAVAESTSAVVLAGMAVLLFFGGWQLPWMSLGQAERSWTYKLAGAALLLVKAPLVVLATVWLRETARSTLASRPFVSALVLSLMALFVTALWTVWAPTVSIERTLGLVTFAVATAIAARFAGRVHFFTRFPPRELDPYA